MRREDAENRVMVSVLAHIKESQWLKCYHI
jgi:hypothetical protein